MREAMSSFDLARLARDLDALAGAHAKKMYQPHYEQVVIRLNVKGAPNEDIVMVRGQRAYLSRRDRPMPVQPPPFAMLLRKHLSNARFLGARQHGFDRILILEFEGRFGRLDLVLEMFRNGNVILLDENGTIIQPLTHVKYETRTIKRGEPYEFPPEPMDPRTFSRDDFAGILADSNRSLVRTLAGRINLGSVYAGALCAAAEAEPEMETEDLSDSQIDTLFSTLNDMFAALEAGGPAIAMLREGVEVGEVDDAWMAENCEEVGPVELPGRAARATIAFPNLSAAIDAWKGAHDATALMRREAEKLAAITAPGQTDGEGDKLARRAAQQEGAIEKLGLKAEKAQALGKSIQENWTHVESLLTQVKAQVDAEGWDATQAAIKSIPWIESANPAARTIRAKLPDESGEPGQSVELHLDESVHQNAQRHFAKGRKDKQRAAGAAAALEDTERRKKKVEKQRAKDEAAGRVTMQKRTKRFWFERHRWTLTPAGHFIIGGRDAKGNDQVVKKHLSNADLYFHADLHGAPSCVLKSRDGLVPDPQSQMLLPEGVRAWKMAQNLEAEFSEADHLAAAQMAVCWSRAWGSGGAAATAYHATPGQVSKTTETGESLGRGGFIVRGTRNWYRDLALELTLGVIAVNGVPIPIVGPHAVINEFADRWVQLRPGHAKKENVATRIAKATGLLQDDVLSALPPGNLELGESKAIF